MLQRGKKISFDTASGGFRAGRKGENHTGISNGALHDICHRLHKRAEGKYQKAVEKCYENRYKYHYCIAGLPFILLQKEFFREKRYTCSSFIARVLEENGLKLFSKHFSLVTPKDFYELEQKEVIYEGELKQLIRMEQYRTEIA